MGGADADSREQEIIHEANANTILTSESEPLLLDSYVVVDIHKETVNRKNTGLCRDCTFMRHWFLVCWNKRADVDIEDAAAGTLAGLKTSSLRLSSVT